MITIAFALTAITSLLLSLASPWSRAPLWKATVTPLASIIGSGFLVSAPLLVREFGGYAAPAMLLLILVAGMIGWTIRYNIRVVEPELARGGDRVLISLEEISHVVLSFAYFVSVAYYLSLLGHFVLEAAGVQNDALAHNIAIALALGLGLAAAGAYALLHGSGGRVDARSARQPVATSSPADPNHEVIDDASREQLEAILQDAGDEEAP